MTGGRCSPSPEHDGLLHFEGDSLAHDARSLHSVGDGSHADGIAPSLLQLYNEVKASFDSHKTRSLDYRKTQLRALAFLIVGTEVGTYRSWIDIVSILQQDNEQALIDAVHQDLNRVGHETVVAEIIPTIHEVKEALNNLDKWAKPVRVKTTAAWALAKATLTSVPKGQ